MECWHHHQGQTGGDDDVPGSRRHRRGHGAVDSSDLHLADTLEAGVGLCDAEAVRILVEEGPDRVRELERLGTKFDQRDGKFILASEGAHSVPRVVRAGGTRPAAWWQTRSRKPSSGAAEPNCTRTSSSSISSSTEAAAFGALSVDGEGELTVSLARAVILACGGAGQVFAHTANPAMATGDGHAMAYRDRGPHARHGVHPVPSHGPLRGREPPRSFSPRLLRGEGAYLRDDGGERFMVGADPRQELAPRDVVVRNMKKVMDRDGVDHVWLDARHLDADFLRTRFPTVFTGLAKRGLDLASELIPIAPASHYYIGGVQTDVWGRTSVPGLYACGETASTGIHGANRLASNSLLEGLVFGERTVRELSCYLSSCDPTVNKIRLDLDEETRRGNDFETVAAGRKRLGEAMAEGCGIVRSSRSLQRTMGIIREIWGSLRPAGRSVPELELCNLLTVAEHMVVSALEREESRGVHLRSDFPERDDRVWRRHVLLQSEPGQSEPAVTLSEREE